MSNYIGGRMNNYIAGIIAVLCLASTCIVGYMEENSTIAKYENRIASYEYLSKYKCWSSELKTTMYTLHPTECSKDKTQKFFGYTFSGLKAVPGRTCAVDPKFIPLGSILIDVETGQLWIAEDTGNKVKGAHVDLCIGEGTNENRKIAAEFACKRRLFIVIEPQGKIDGGWLKNIMKEYDVVKKDLTK